MLQRGTTSIRGSNRVESEKLYRQIKKQKKNSDLFLAGVPLIKNSETQHILLTGTTGAGKSVCMQDLMDQVRMRKQRAIVYDIEGTFIPAYFRPDKDIILNPLDERSVSWNIWQECFDLADFESIANALMPLHLAGTDPFWINSARIIFSSASMKLLTQNKCSTRELIQPLFTEDLGGLCALLRGTVAESLVSDRNEKTALSIKATLATYCKALMYLYEEKNKPLFSIRKWLTEESGDGWLFIASNALKIDALKPLLSVWLDVAAKTVLSLPQSQTRRLWFFLDELASLHKLPSLTNTLSRGRKYGGCFVAAIQDIHQIRAIYGRDETESFTSLFNTHLCFRTKCPDSAVWMSKIMGSREIIEQKEGFSYGANEIRDGVSIHQERRKEPLVLDSEFLNLDDLYAFLKLSGDWPVTKLKFKIKQRSATQPALIEKNLENSYLNEISFLPKNNEEDEESPDIEKQIKKKESRVKIKRLDKKTIGIGE